MALQELAGWRVCMGQKGRLQLATVQYSRASKRACVRACVRGWAATITPSRFNFVDSYRRP